MEPAQPWGTGRLFDQRWPQVTLFSGGNEAPDETAHAERLNLVAKAGISYLMGSVKYLRDGHYTCTASRKTLRVKRCR